MTLFLRFSTICLRALDIRLRHKYCVNVIIVRFCMIRIVPIRTNCHVNTGEQLMCIPKIPFHVRSCDKVVMKPWNKHKRIMC